jgi:hypothetical protein
VRRAVGARRSDLTGAALLEGATLALVAAAIGTAVGLAGARWAASTWPGAAIVPRTIVIGVIALIGGLILLGAMFPLFGARSRRVSEVAPAPPPLIGIGVLLASGLAVLVAGGLVNERAGALLGQRGSGAAGEGTLYQVALDSTPAERARVYRTLLSELENLPGVEVASLHSPGALAGLGTVDLVRTDCSCAVGGIFLRWRLTTASYHFASADTFYARGVRVAEGRGFTAADSVGSAPVAVINRYLAGRYFQSGQALGRDIWLGGGLSGAKYQVIGVVDDGRPAALGGGAAPREAVYLSVLQHPGTGAELLVRPASAGAVAGAALERALGRRLAGEPEAAARRREIAPLEWFARWFGIEGALVLGLATVGVFGMMRLWIRAVRSELAVKRAVGARRRHVVGYALARAAGAGLQGVAIAVLFVAPALWSELGRILPGLREAPIDLVARSAVILVGAALLGALLPALAAARRPPAADLGGT